MKIARILIALLCALCLIAACAAYADDAADDYDAIQTLMGKAVKDPDQAEEQFSQIKTYYERNSALKGYRNSNYYYKYAKGRLLFADGDYEGAYNCFYGLPDSFYEGVEVAYYLRFCEAVWDKQDAESLNRIEDYETAINSFKEAKGLTEWPDACIEQIADCEACCGELIKKEAAKCCEAGDHETAQGYYDRMIAFENKSYSREGKRLKEACIKHSGFSVSTPTIEYLGENMARISWTTTCESVLLTVKHGKDPFSVTLTENHYDVANAAPGDKIDVTVEGVDAGLSAVKTQLTVPKIISVKAHYEDGMKYLEAGLYVEARDSFTKAGSYEDASFQLQFCEGMICLAEADEDEAAGYLKWAAEHTNEAKQHFILLQGVGFEGADKLAAYCEARACEYGGMYQPALDQFAELGVILDSVTRFERLAKKERLKEVEPPPTLPSLKSAVKGTVSRSANSYAGPGNKYAKESIVKIGAEQEVDVLGLEGEYYLIEIQKDKKLYRIWYPKMRVNVSGVMKCGEKPRSVRLLEETEVFYGPGVQYASRGISLPRNMKMTAYEAEDIYSMIEYTLDGNTYRGWVPTDKLRDIKN